MSLMQRRRALMGANKGSGYAHGTWEDLFWHIDKGDYASEYSIGEEISTILVNSNSFPFQIVAFDADTISDTTEKAPVTLISTRLYVKRKYNDADTDPVSDGYGTYGGWDKSNAREYCNTSAFANLPVIVRDRIVSVKKYSRIRYAGMSVKNNVLTNDKVWMPGTHELNVSSATTSGPTYNAFFTSNAKRVKKSGSQTTAYWTRDTATSSSSVLSTIATTGAASTASPTASDGYAIGFCVGKGA